MRNPSVFQPANLSSLVRVSIIFVTMYLLSESEVQAESENPVAKAHNASETNPASKIANASEIALPAKIANASVIESSMIANASEIALPAKIANASVIDPAPKIANASEIGPVAEIVNASVIGRAVKAPVHATTVSPKGGKHTTAAAKKATETTTRKREPAKKAYMVRGKLVYEVPPTTKPRPKPTAPAPRPNSTCALAGEDCSKLACCSFMDTCGEYFSAPNTCGTDTDGDSY